MGLTKRLLSHFDTDNLLLACKLLVEEAFGNNNGNNARDLDSLARDAGIIIKTEQTHWFDGRFVSDSEGTSTITLTTLSGRSRSRFTLAHELGHWLLRQSGKTSVYLAFRGVAPENRADAEEERIANFMAAELLLPIDHIAKSFQHSKIEMAAIRGIARRFDVSFKAALRRVADVVDREMLYLNLVPHRFRNLASYAEVDEAFYISPLNGMHTHRDETRLVRRYSFQEIFEARTMRVGIVNRLGRFFEEFEIRSSMRPVPNCDLLATVGQGVRKLTYAT